MEYFNKYFIGVIKNYMVFEGRARRKEYWFFVLFYFLISLVLDLIEVALGLYVVGGMGILSLILSLILLLPSLAVGARRLHDIDKSAWWLLIALIPLIGVIVLLVFFCLKGTDGPNRFGEDPLA